MSGSALSPFAVARYPYIYTAQLTRALNCSNGTAGPADKSSSGIDCLRRKSVEELMGVKVRVPNYLSALAPVVDGIVVRDEPIVMLQNASQFDVDLLFGITRVSETNFYFITFS